ncbi:MAG: hypothetical protein ABSA82_07640 [Thermacetogeniaceae bacterium]|jgi:hypothetical protein
MKRSFLIILLLSVAAMLILSVPLAWADSSGAVSASVYQPNPYQQQIQQELQTLQGLCQQCSAPAAGGTS